MKQPPGLPVDSSGNQTIDPTANVLALVKASIERLDDLAAAESRRVNEQLALRADYSEKLSNAEAKRIDAIRAVDVNAVAVASERASAQASVLANQVAQSAEALRTLVSTSATTLANQQTQIITPILERLSSLEKAQYEGMGKQKVEDPMMAQMLLEMKAMRNGFSEKKGSGEGMKNLWVLITGGVLFLIALASFIIEFLE